MTLQADFSAYAEVPTGSDITPLSIPTGIPGSARLIAPRFYGGAAGTGFLVQLDTGSITPRAEFDTISSPLFFNKTGALPNGDLVQRGSTWYGTAVYGGANGVGVIYGSTDDGATMFLLHSFTSGLRPHGGLIVGSDTNLYGVTFAGGAVYRWGF